MEPEADRAHNEVPCKHISIGRGVQNAANKDREYIKSSTCVDVYVVDKVQYIVPTRVRASCER